MTRLRTLYHRMLSTEEGRLLLSAVATLLTGTIFYARVEGWSVVDALYFCVATLTTVGYGDLHPTRDISKLFTVAYLITGIGLLAALIDVIGKRRAASAERKAEEYRAARGGSSTHSGGDTDSAA